MEGKVVELRPKPLVQITAALCCLPCGASWVERVEVTDPRELFWQKCPTCHCERTLAVVLPDDTVVKFVEPR